MTPQEIFDTVGVHLLTMKEQSRSQIDKTCAYRGDNGARCAAGIILPDEYYRPWMDDECKSPINAQGFRLNSTLMVDIIRYNPDALPAWMVSNGELISELQSVHDNDEYWLDSGRLSMKIGLMYIASKFNLDGTKVARTDGYVIPSADEYENDGVGC